MELEMEMRAMEDIEIGTDITPPLTPLTFSLHTSRFTTHCSTCFSLLPPSPITLSSYSYCSPPCSAAHLHHPSPDDDDSDLRAAFRLLLHHRPDPCSGRIAGLLSNRPKLTWNNRFHVDDEVSERINVGTGELAAAMAKQRGGRELDDAVLEDAAVTLCAVLTNAVEVQDKEGRALGVAVFGSTFSWINHSCSPNACYRFVLSSPSSASSEESKLQIAPFARGSRDSEIESGVCSSSSEFSKEGEHGYGPRLIVRSIKRIKKGEEVTVAYTDILQPKAMRQLDLWSKYRFVCCCRRCSAVPFTYVDHALQEISVSNGVSAGSYSHYEVLRDIADRRLTDSVEDTISEYFTVGDPESSCQNLEEILMQGLSEQLDDTDKKLHYRFMLQPLHYLSLNAYTTLASAYKVCAAADFLSACPESGPNILKAFDKGRTSAAYSLLLAGATHHLFKIESSFIASIANFWTGAGESLLSFARRSEWDKFIKSGLVISNLLSVTNLKCSRCSLMDTFRACMSSSQIRSDDFENVSAEFLHCVSDVTKKVWSFLVYGCHFFKSIKDPVDFSWLMPHNPRTVDLEVQICEEQAYRDNAREHILQLGVHCLAYGGLLATICYGHHSQLACYVQHILDR